MRSKKFLKASQVSLSWDCTGLMAGVDEAGRGPLAGPVVAAAVILDIRNPIKGLADSKKLTALRRDRLFDEIRAKALCCSIAQASVEEIDHLNILQATLLAMRRAVEGLRLKPKLVLVDGNRIPVLEMLAEAIVKGDALVPSISAASILAKVHRDRWCAELHLQYPRRRSWPRCTVTAGAPSCTCDTPSTALRVTRATARWRTWRRCVSMVPARSTA